MRNQSYDYMAPIWSGDTSLFESFMPLACEGAAEDEPVRVPLLYSADEILEVRSSNLETVFSEGEDYLLWGGELIIPPGSPIKTVPWKSYNPQAEQPNSMTPTGFASINGGYLLFGEGDMMHRLQYAVSYKHGGSWLGPIPRAAEEKLPKFRAKIRAGKQVRVAFTGDSITTGANSSAVVGAPPFLPMWPDMVTDFIDDNYPSKEGKTVNINRSLGGVCSDWGAFTARESFGKESPDLCVIAYGMNDASGRYTSLFVKENYRKIAEILLDINPDCEFIFVSTTLPNPIAVGFTTGLHFEHEALLAELTGEMGDIAALAPVTNMHRYLLTRKRFADMTGNNINHPNDWLARVYAQVICTVMI